LPATRPFFVTLNPPATLRQDTILHEEVYEHPIFDQAALAAQERLWALQGARRSWYCGAYFGSGFHEDGSAGRARRRRGDRRRAAALAGPMTNPGAFRSPCAARVGGMIRHSALYVGRVRHHRFRPRPHALSYRVFWTLLDLNEIDAMAGQLRLFSRNRFNLYCLPRCRLRRSERQGP
jgi:hypothetical protein